MEMLDQPPTFKPQTRLYPESSRMPSVRGARAHGGQGATAGKIVQLTRIEAQLRGTTQTIRVWQGFGAAEEFTIDEARNAVRYIHHVLARNLGRSPIRLEFRENGQGGMDRLLVDRDWVIGFVGAMRRALKAYDTAQALAPKPVLTCIDTESDPGAWARHLRDTAHLRGPVTDEAALQP